MDDKLLPHRDAIDAIDRQILTLLNERATHARAIGALKGTGAVYRPEREAQVLRRIKDLNEGPLPDEGVARLFREVMSECLAVERPLTIAYLGPMGTFTQMAAIKHFGHAAVTVPCTTVDDSVRLVEARQALAQCQFWLNAHLGGDVQRVAVSSNGEAARLAQLDENVAAIASQTAAEIYGLTKIAENIEDEPNNTTRFLVLGHQDTTASGKDKTTLIVSAPNQVGMLHRVIEPLTRAGISLTKFESRPSRTGLWEYLFFIDIEGHESDERVQAALAQLRETAAFVKVVGSYPMAVL